MNRRSVLEASVAALATLIAWWGGVLSLDGALAARLPYAQYETAALLYPDVYYPGVAGLYVVQALYAIGLDAVLGGATFVLGLLGWTVALSVAIGAGATRYAVGRDLSSAIVAVALVVALFVAVTAIEAVGTLLA